MNKLSEGKTKKRLFLCFKYLVLILMLIITVYPVLWMIFGAFKDDYEFYNNIWGMASDLRIENFVNAWDRAALGQKYINSIIITVLFLVILLPIASCAAYVIARMPKSKFRCKEIIYLLLLVGIVIPRGVLAIPIYQVIVALGLANTRISLVLVYVAQFMSFSIFLMRGYYASLPKGLEDAARIDGCGWFKSFWYVMTPLTKPGLLTVAIFGGLNVWNEYFLSSILIRSQELQTIPLGLAIFVDDHNVYYPELFAALTIATVPVVLLYIVAQKKFIQGLTAGAVKG